MGILQKQFVNHFGLDLRSSDIVRSEQHASLIKNAQYKKDGSIEKRKGYRACAESVGGSGLFVYNRIDPETGLEEDILLSADDSLHRLVDGTFTINYAGADPIAILEIFVDPDTETLKCQITEGTTVVLDEDLGKGFDEASIVDLSDLKTAIDAVAGFSATIVGSTTIPAAFLTLARSYDLNSSDYVGETKIWEEVNSPATLPFAAHFAKVNDPEWEIMSAQQINNVLYISNGYDEVQKYDGQNLYRAGLPDPNAPTTALGGAGVLTGAYQHTIVYAQYDAVGNLVESSQSGASATLNPVAQSINVTVENILAASGFNTNCAIVVGAQVAVTTINVDNGSGGAHTLLPGDSAYFFDSVTGAYVVREVLAVTATTIDILGAGVTVADNAVISNNLRIGIYRNENGGTVRFLSAEIPNNSFAATQVYNDNVTDANLGIEFVDDPFTTSLPPKGKYIAAFYNQLFISGNIEFPNLVAPSLSNKVEKFPISLAFKLQSKNGDPISGMKQNNEVFAVFERRATHTISGDIESFQVRIDTLSEDIGCAAHASIQEALGALYFASDRGIYSMISGQLPVPQSDLIEPAFDEDDLTPMNQRGVLKRSVAINLRDAEQYMLFVPSEPTSATKYANEFSRVYVQDYNRGAWLEWDNVNMAGGACLFNNRLLWVERRLSGFTAAVEHILYNQSNRGDSYDYQDHVETINFEYGTSWYSFGEPSIFKRFLRLKIFGLNVTLNNEFTLDADIQVNYLKDVTIGTVNIDLSGGAEGYGVSPYGVSPYGDFSDPAVKVKIGPIKAKSLRFILKNSEPLTNVEVTGWELEFQSPHRSELKE